MKVSKYVLVFLISLLFQQTIVFAKTVEIKINSRKIVENYKGSDQYGSYEIIKGVIYLSVDPRNNSNEQIVDLKLAPKNEQGFVEFSTEFELHKPVDATRANRRLLYFVSNRGNKMGSGFFSFGHDYNWLYSKGYSYLWCGWNCDVPESDKKINIKVPIVTNKGKTITGKVYSELISFANSYVKSLPIVWGNSLAYAPVDLDQKEAVLSMRQYRDDEPIIIARENWKFARFENNEIIPDSMNVYIEEGFKPGWLYDLVYTAKNPKVTGLGMAAIRDVVSFFKFDKVDSQNNPNPLYKNIDFTFAWGHSQSGRLLNHFVYQNFNKDERNRKIFDGIISNCPGAGKGSFNMRFAQFTRHGSHHEDNLYPIDIFPFASVKQYDPITKKYADAFKDARDGGNMPKMMFINSSTDYWTRAASLLHTNVEGTKDLEIASDVRIYSIAGLAHIDSKIGVISRSLLIALEKWVDTGIEPPASEYPKIIDGTLVGLEEWKSKFPEIKGMIYPDSYYEPYRLDFGKSFNTKGVAKFTPPKVDPKYITLVPQVDEDGNEIAGIRFPEIEAPLATYTGWDMRRASFSNSIKRNTGKIWPFSIRENSADTDSRGIINQRYKNENDYFFAYEAALSKLKSEGFLLEEDFLIMKRKAAAQSKLVPSISYIDDVAVEYGVDSSLMYFMKIRNADLSWIYGYADVSQFLTEVTDRGANYIKNKEYQHALELFKLNTTLFGNDANSWYYLGECYFGLKNQKLALQSFEKSLKLNPESTRASEMIEKLKR